MMDIKDWPQTGRRRLAARLWGACIILVLQIETKSNNSPVYHWRDATVADLTAGDEGLAALKVAA